VNELITDWLAGEDVELVPMELPPLPADALPSERVVARFAVIVKGLKLGAANRWPMVLAREWVADWLADPRMASACSLERPIKARMAGNCLKNPTAWGVLAVVGTVKVRGRPRPAYLYELGAVDGRGGRAEVAGLEREQPGDEAAAEGDVLGAEARGAARRALGIAAGDGAGGGGGRVVHAAHARPWRGGQPSENEEHR